MRFFRNKMIIHMSDIRSQQSPFVVTSSKSHVSIPSLDSMVHRETHLYGSQKGNLESYTDLSQLIQQVKRVRFLKLGSSDSTVRFLFTIFLVSNKIKNIPRTNRESRGNGQNCIVLAQNTRALAVSSRDLRT